MKNGGLMMNNGETDGGHNRERRKDKDGKKENKLEMCSVVGNSEVRSQHTTTNILKNTRGTCCTASCVK